MLASIILTLDQYLYLFFLQAGKLYPAWKSAEMGAAEELKNETVTETDEQLNLLRPCKSSGLSGQADTFSVSSNLRGSRNSATTLDLHESARLKTESRPEQSPSNWNADWIAISMGEVRPALTETRVHVFQFLWTCCKYLERDRNTKKQRKKERRLRCSKPP